MSLIWGREREREGGRDGGTELIYLRLWKSLKRTKKLSDNGALSVVQQGWSPWTGERPDY